jgi:hypothetical protein
MFVNIYETRSTKVIYLIYIEGELKVISVSRRMLEF